MSTEWPRLSLEVLVSRQPDCVLLVKGSAVTLETLQRQAGWSSLEAIAKGRVFYVDDRIDFPSPLAFDALEDLAKQLHP